MNIKRKIFHLYKKVTRTNDYYGSLKAVFDEHKDLGVSKYKMDRWDFNEKQFENEVCVLIKSVMKTTGDVFENKNKKFKFFYNGIFSNWFPCVFVINGIKYECVEQYMMYQKAITFNDIKTAKKILKEHRPAKQKQLGREVKNFNPEVWDKVKYKIVKEGIKEKFNQNPSLKGYLLSHKGYTIVEASQEDRIWGIGYFEEDAIANIDNWGENLLGKILTELSNEIKN